MTEPAATAAECQTCGQPLVLAARGAAVGQACVNAECLEFGIRHGNGVPDVDPRLPAGYRLSGPSSG